MSMNMQFRTSPSFPHRRGVAMLLVLVSLMTATVLTISYLASRDNSGVIGENVAKAAAARWAAEAGLELGIAALQTQAKWRAQASDGYLIYAHPLGDAIVSVELLDLETNAPPWDSSEHLQLTSHAIIDGIEQVATATVYVPLDVNQSVDVDLSEFAIFSTETITLSGDAVVTRWPNAPLSVLGKPVALGTLATGASSVMLLSNAAIINGRIYHPPGASASLISTSTGVKIPSIGLPDVVPVPTPPASGVGEPQAFSFAPPLDFIGGTGTILANTRAAAIAMTSNAIRTVKGTLSVVSNGDFSLTDSTLIIDGHVTMVVFNDLSLVNASIELQPDARLKLFVRGEIRMQDSYIGELRTDNLRDNTGSAAYMDPERVLIFRMANRGAETTWQLEGNSVAKASMYACDTMFAVKDNSALYGRVMAGQILLSGNGALFYDPSLDSRTGYINTNGPLYESDGSLKEAFRTLTSLDSAVLQAVADNTGAFVKDVLEPKLIRTPAGADSLTGNSGDPYAATPRNVKVEYVVNAIGSCVDSWENDG